MLSGSFGERLCRWKTQPAAAESAFVAQCNALQCTSGSNLLGQNIVEFLLYCCVKHWEDSNRERTEENKQVNAFGFLQLVVYQKGSWKTMTKLVRQETSVSKRKHPLRFWQIAYFAQHKLMTLLGF